MAGIERDTPIPTDIRLHKKSRILELCYENGERFELDCEFLRVFTPSAEARGHAPGQEVLQTGKRNVEIERIEPVGTYAVRLVFSDGHDSGIYSWGYLHELCREQQKRWADYLARLSLAGASREPTGPVLIARQ